MSISSSVGLPLKVIEFIFNIVVQDPNTAHGLCDVSQQIAEWSAASRSAAGALLNLFSRVELKIYGIVVSTDGGVFPCGLFDSAEDDYVNWDHLQRIGRHVKHLLLVAAPTTKYIVKFVPTSRISG